MTRRGWLFFAAMSLIWGIPYLLIKVVDNAGISPAVLVFARTAIGAVVLLPIALRSGSLKVLRDHWWAILIFTVTEIIGPWFFLSDAERKLTSSLSGLLVAAVPIIGAIMVQLTGERFGAWRWAGLTAGFAGVIVLAAPNLRGGDTWSVTEVLLVAVGYAFSPILAARRLQGVPSLLMTPACLTLAAVVYATPAVLNFPSKVPSAGALASLAVLGVVCTAAGFVVFFLLIREVGAPRSVVITYVNPAVAVAAGVSILGEPLTLTMVVAFALILGGSLLATLRRGMAETVTSAEAGEISPGDLAPGEVTAG
jgi:drug/metabolite transporter (DMT)-like permease